MAKQRDMSLEARLHYLGMVLSWQLEQYLAPIVKDIFGCYRTEVTLISGAKRAKM